MANEEHLKILKQGVEVWNKWRRENFKVVPDLTGVNLFTDDLAGANLDGADLSWANLEGADLTGADLNRADLTWARLGGGDLIRADLIRAKLNGAGLAFADLTGAKLGGADLTGADLTFADLTGAQLDGAVLSRANLSDADLIGAKLSNADLTGAKLSGASFNEANVAGVKYARKAMRGCYGGVRGVDSCYGNPIFRRDALDQDYIDTVEHACNTRLKKFMFRLWALIDFGRSMPRVAIGAFGLMLVFGLIYSVCPWLIRVDKDHIRTGFTPFYYSIVTYTTLGFGDVSARHLAGEILVATEVVLGYITLGLLLAILANTVARRS